MIIHHQLLTVIIEDNENILFTTYSTIKNLTGLFSENGTPKPDRTEPKGETIHVTCVKIYLFASSYDNNLDGQKIFL